MQGDEKRAVPILQVCENDVEGSVKLNVRAICMTKTEIIEMWVRNFYGGVLEQKRQQHEIYIDDFCTCEILVTPSTMISVKMDTPLWAIFQTEVDIIDHGGKPEG